jgi:SAM-dependent methyltransferase
VQARLTLELMARWPGARVLEVGGGHAQLTAALLDAGHEVVVYGSDASCATRLRPLLDAGRATFAAGDLLHTPYADRSFDLVLCFRLLPHAHDWHALVGELCRLARHAVVVDYPTTRSANAVSGALFGVKKQVEGDTRPFRVFTEAEIRDAFAARGFTVTARRPQFFVPMAVHRALGLAPLSRGLEGAAGALGMTGALGSPVIARAERLDA